MIQKLINLILFLDMVL